MGDTDLLAKRDQNDEDVTEFENFEDMYDIE
jgi:hypothetical protein